MRRIFYLKQPYANHNGGFGPDGLLYVGTGDGGGAGDPLEAAQDPKSLLGKILRFDIEARDPAPEIWAKGLRNPGATASTARPATSTSPTWGRTSGRK